ncbi:MAG: hypothetical protein ACWA5L_09765 [bacterium]
MKRIITLLLIVFGLVVIPVKAFTYDKAPTPISLEGGISHPITSPRGDHPVTPLATDHKKAAIHIGAKTLPVYILIALFVGGLFSINIQRMVRNKYKA